MKKNLVSFVMFAVIFLANSPGMAASGRLVEDLVACADRALVEKLHVILLGDNREQEFVNAVEANVTAGKCIELPTGQKISIKRTTTPDHDEIRGLPYKMLLVSKTGKKKQYWIYDVESVKRK